MAKNKEVARACTKAFEEFKVQKVYWARVKGHPSMFDEHLINAPIRRKKGFVFECGDPLKGALGRPNHVQSFTSRRTGVFGGMSPHNRKNPSNSFTLIPLWLSYL